METGSEPGVTKTPGGMLFTAVMDRSMALGFAPSVRLSMYRLLP